MTEAPDGARALGLLREPPFPDVVLLDLAMPGIDGLGVLTELRDARGMTELPIVLMSAADKALTRRLAGSLGANLVTKPLDPVAVRSLCAALAERGRPDDHEASHGEVVAVPDGP